MHSILPWLTQADKYESDMRHCFEQNHEDEGLLHAIAARGHPRAATWTPTAPGGSVQPGVWMSIGRRAAERYGLSRSEWETSPNA